MWQKIKKGILLIVLGFIILFLLRLAYGYIAYPNGKVEEQAQNYVSTSNFEFSGRNYASKKMKRSAKGQAISSPMQVDQKYEKVASMASRSAEFQEDRQQVQGIIKAKNALIQFEQSGGLPKSRYLHLAIGVDPNLFDEMIKELKQIGKLSSISVNKTDKTNEYKDLNAKKVSLEKARNSLIALKTQGGQIEELIELETRILDIESQIQGLGVNLGEFDKENEFCTVKFTLQETPSLIREIDLASRIKTAFEWTLIWYTLFLFMLTLAGVFSLVLIVLIEKGKQTLGQR